jgi:hypothetical protein
MHQYLECQDQKHKINYKGVTRAKLQRSDTSEATTLPIQSTVKPSAVANDETQSRKATDAGSKS